MWGGVSRVVGGGMRECARAAGVGWFREGAESRDKTHESVVAEQELEIGFSYTLCVRLAWVCGDGGDGGDGWVCAGTKDTCGECMWSH